MDKEVEMQFCEYCQEYVPVELSTGECTQGCNNPVCPYDVFEDTQRDKPLDFNDEARNSDEENDYSRLVEDTQGGC